MFVGKVVKNCTGTSINIICHGGARPLCQRGMQPACKQNINVCGEKLHRHLNQYNTPWRYKTTKPTVSTTCLQTNYQMFVVRNCTGTSISIPRRYKTTVPMPSAWVSTVYDVAITLNCSILQAKSWGSSLEAVWSVLKALNSRSEGCRFSYWCWDGDVAQLVEHWLQHAH